jgi:hypothetical protein
MILYYDSFSKTNLVTKLNMLIGIIFVFDNWFLYNGLYMNKCSYLYLCLYNCLYLYNGFYMNKCLYLYLCLYICLYLYCT